MNPSTRLLPSGRGKNIHFYKKHRRVDPIHFTMSSSTKTTQPRDPAKSSHFRRKMAQHKRDQPKQAGAASTAQPPNLIQIEHTRAQKRARHFVHGSGRPSIDRKNRKLEVQNCVGGRPRQASKDHEPNKMELQNMSVAGPVKTTSLALWNENTSLAGPTKTMRLTNEA